MALTNDTSPPTNGASNNSDVQMSFQFPAIRYTQGDGRILYSFVADGKQLRQFTTISRVKRDEQSTELLGYQRPEVVNHKENSGLC